jgi:hypothetical protein
MSEWDDYVYYQRVFKRITTSLPREAAAFIFAELVNDILTRGGRPDGEKLAALKAMNQAYQDTI